MRKNEQPCSPPLSAVPPESLLGAAQITGDRGQIRKFWVNLRRYDKGNPACRPVGTEQFRRRRHRRPHRGVQRCSLVARLPRCTRRHPAGKARCFGRRQQHPLYGGFSRNAAAPRRRRFLGHGLLGQQRLGTGRSGTRLGEVRGTVHRPRSVGDGKPDGDTGNGRRRSGTKHRSLRSRSEGYRRIRRDPRPGHA